MAKRTKKAKSSRSNLRVETLEQRQLLATIVAGSGTEVASNVTLPQGTYDQILMTGSTITVMADPGEVVRVSFLDQGGDIVQAEFGGHGTMTISLEDFKSGTATVNKNPDQLLNGQKINYVQGLASITVANPQIDTNFGLYSAGPLTNPGFYAGQSKTGDNNMADIARLLLVGDPTNGAGYSNMGGIRAGNAVFSAQAGVVGIRGENVAVHDIVAIGDIDAKGSGVPTLMFNSNSQFQTVYVRGGDLFQTNGTSFDSFGNGEAGAPGGSPGIGQVSLGGFSFFNSTDGTTSAGKLLWATPVNASAIRLATVDQQTLMSGDWVYDWTNPSAVKVTQNGVDVSAAFGGDWLAKGGIQASMDYAFERRTFLGNITIKGDVAVNTELNIADARGNVTFENNMYGYFTVNGFGAGIDGTLTIKGKLDGAIAVTGIDRTGISPLAGDGQQNVINALVVEGSTGEFTDVRAEDIGSVIIRGSFSGIISTDVTRGNAWTPSQAKTGTGYVDVEGKIGDVTIGYDAAGKSTGGSIVNGMIQGMSGIGNVKVGGDIYGTAPNIASARAVFSTVSNSGAAPTDVRNYGSANIGTISVLGDVDLDSPSDRLIFINGNGTYGDIEVKGQTTTNTVPGPQIGTKTELIAGSEAFVRILSPFTDKGFTIDTSKGQKLVTNYDPDGTAGPLNDTYFVTKADVAAGAQIYDLTSGKMVAAKEGDRVPALTAGGTPIFDAFGNVVYAQNTALFEGKTQTVPVYGPDIVTIVSGNRGNLNGVFNNFGRIEIAGLTGAQQKTTGKITWTDSVDMNFGGVTVNSNANQNDSVTGNAATIGQITINNTSGATSDLVFSGVIGAKNNAIAGTNGGTSFIGLTGLTATGFEDVFFASVSDVSSSNNIIHTTGVTNGISITTVAGVGNGQGPGTVSPSVIFDSIIQLDNGTSEATQTALLTINAGMTNSTVGFNGNAGIVVDDGGNTGSGSALGPINLAADYVYFSGLLSGRTMGALTLTGGQGINSNSDTGVKFDGRIAVDSLASVAGSANGGNVVFAPTQIVGLTAASTNGSLNNVKTANIGSITLTTAGTNNGGDITLGNATPTYNVNTGNITLTAGHKLFLNQAGTVLDNPGDIAINFATTGNIGDLSATTTTGNINNALTVQGNAGNITYTAGAAVVDKLDTFGGAVGDVARWGNITATQTIWGNRGVTTFTTAGQKADGTASTLDFTVGTGASAVNYKVLPAGTINATLNYAGASTATGDAFIAKTGAGNATINYNIIGNDDNKNGVIDANEIGHGGNVNVSSISGDLTFAGGSQLTDYTHTATMGNVVLKTGTYAQTSGLLTGAQIGDITLSFNDLAGAPVTGGYEGAVGNISATTTGGNITFAQSRFDAKVGNVTLTTGAVTHTGGVAVGNISTIGTGVTFNAGQGLVKATTTDVGTINTTFYANGPQAATGNGFELTSQYGAINATIGAGSFDQNNNGGITADEFGRTGNIAVTSSGGAIALTLDSNKYTSDLEQSLIGNVTITNQAFVDVKNGGLDVVGSGKSALGSAIAGANGNITITGAATQVGGVGNLVANTDVGTITHNGIFGDLGTSTFKTTFLVDQDTNPNLTTEAPILLGAGNIVLGTGFSVAKNNALQVNGKHGLATYEVQTTGTINGTAYYGGPLLSGETASLSAKSESGNVSLTIYLQDADRDGSGTITANEYGKFGTASITTSDTAIKTYTNGSLRYGGGDINLQYGTDQNNAAVLARNLVPEFTFGAVTLKAGDQYTSTSATATDVLADAGNITFTGVGADATVASSLGSVTGNRGNVDSLKADTVRGNISVNGNFAGLGDQTLTVTGYKDATSATNTNVLLGAINFNPSIYGTSGTAILRTDDTGTTGSGTITGGAISGVATYGGALATGKTVSVDAKTGRANINLDIISTGYDINGDGKITDGSGNNIPGDFEFGKVGNVIVETTNAGDITLGLGTTTADGSKIGSSIGSVSAIANDDIYTAVANGPDTATNLANVTIIGKSPFPIGGTVGDIGITVNTGTATLTGNFGSIGGVTVNTATYTDTSSTGGLPQVIAGNIQLGTGTATSTSTADTAGFTTLNIAGSYNDSVLTVTESGTITGAVYVAGTGGKSWTLNSAAGAINVGFIAGFDADNVGGITTAEAGALGAITATSQTGNVTIGVGGRNASSTIGAVTVSTGDKVTVVAEAADTFTSGNATVTGLSGAGLGTVGAVTASVKTGVATLNGTFGGLAGATITTDAYVDADTAVGAGEESVVIKAGDIALGAAIWGAHGTINATTVDSSKLAAGKSAVAGTVGDTGTISGSLAFSGGLTTGTTAGVVGKTDRGAINVNLTAGIDEAGGATAYASGEAGTVGTVALTSTDGNISVNLDVANVGSSFGGTTLTTGSTYTAKAEAADVLVAAGSITIGSTLGQNYGNLGAVTATTASGNITQSGTYVNIGAITHTAGTYADLDTAVGAGEVPVVLASGNISVPNLTALGTHGLVTLNTVAPAVDVFSGGTITANLVFGGAVTSGSKSVVATSEAGAVAVNVEAKVNTLAIDTNAGVSTAVDYTGNVSDVELTSAYGNITSTLTTGFNTTFGSSTSRVGTIGNVTATTGSRFATTADAADTVIGAGAITLTGASTGKIGNITGTTATGLVTLNGSFSRTVGNIALTAGSYADGDTAPGAGEPSVIIAAGSVNYSPAFGFGSFIDDTTTANSGTFSATTVGTVTLNAAGSTANAGVAGNVTDGSTVNGTWYDIDGDGAVDANELPLYSQGKYQATVTDGTINYGLSSLNFLTLLPIGASNANVATAGFAFAGFGAKLDDVTLKTTGANAGAINITAAGDYSQVTNFTASAAKGNISQTGTFQSPNIQAVTLRATDGNVTVSGGYLLDMAAATGNKTTNVAINGITLQADNGNVTLSGTIGENINYSAANLLPTGTTDNRTATISNVSLIAANGAADNLTADGNVLISGTIGGSDITRIDGLVLNAGNTIDDTTTFSNTTANNILAWNIGSLTTTGTTKFTNTGGAVNILADDSTTTRTRNGSVNYGVATSATVAGKGSVLNTIDNITFNGAVVGGTGNSLKTGNVAEIMASKIGNFTVNANVDPTSSTVFSVQNFDMSANPLAGELIAATSAATAFNTLDKFSIGNVTINHNLQGASVGSAVFAGSSVISAGGAMGNIAITSTLKGTVQAPMFAAGSNGNAWFVVGDINGTVGAANTEAAYALKTTDGTALVAMPTAKVTVGNVTVDVGSSYVPPAVQNADIGNAGGGTGGGFAVAVAVDVNAAGNFFSAAAAPAVAIDSTGARTLIGSIGAVSIANNSIRPDNDSVGAAPTGAAAPGAVVVAGNTAVASNDILDIVNELTPAGVVPMTVGQYYTVGDVNGNGDATADDVVVYVL